MTPISVRDIRNLSLLGQSGSGKTTLLEKLLATSGAIGSPGTVERGDTVSDYDPQEKALGHSLNSAVAHLEWAEHWINAIDTPGLPDFLGRALATLPAVETAVVVVNAAAGVETVTRKVMEAAAGQCRMIVINRIDAPGVDFGALLERIGASFGKECLPINLPAPGGEAVIDCFFAPDYAAATAFSSVREAHDRIVDQVVEVDEALMALYLEQGESLQPEQLHDPFEQGPARRPPDSGVLHLGTQWRRREGIARRDGAPAARPHRRQPAPLPQGRRAGRRAGIRHHRRRQTRHRPRVPGQQRPLPRQARPVPHPPRYCDAEQPALHRRRPQAL